MTVIIATITVQPRQNQHIITAQALDNKQQQGTLFIFSILKQGRRVGGVQKLSLKHNISFQRIKIQNTTKEGIMTSKFSLICAVLSLLFDGSAAFATRQPMYAKPQNHKSAITANSISLFMSVENDNQQPSTGTTESSTIPDPMDDAMEEVDDATREMLEKQRRAQELREQEVFMKLSTGKHLCSNCDWEYDETKGDSMMIGGMIKPGTKFDETPSDWRCPVCRASKDAFLEVVEEIPGFEVNQGYGFGANSWTSGQKNLAVFGGLGAFFILFLSGYAMS